MKKSALMLLIILLPLAVKAQTPYRNEDGKKIDKEELETKDYLPSKCAMRVLELPAMYYQ